MAQQPFGRTGFSSGFDSEQLPPGWEMLFDKGTGWPFFVDHINQITTWQDPRRQKMGMHSDPYTHHSQPKRVVEIPIMHETGGRSVPPQYHQPQQERPQTPPRQNQHQFTRNDSPSRQIPIFREEGRSSPSSFRTGTPPRHGFSHFGMDTTDSGSPRQFGGMHGPRSFFQDHERSHSPRSSAFQHQQPEYGFRHYTQPHMQQHEPEVSSNVRRVPIVRGQSGEYENHKPAPAAQMPNRSQEHKPQPMEQDPEPPRPPQAQAPQVHVPQPAQPPVQPQQEKQYSAEPQPQKQYTAEPQVKKEAPPVTPTQTEAQGSPSNTLSPDAPQRGRSVSPMPQHLTPLEHIEMVMQEAEKLRKDVEEYKGIKTEKAYKFIEEMLTRCLIKLDRIESEGNDEIRQARKGAVRTVQSTLDQLELKAFANETSMPETDSKSDSTSEKSAESGPESGRTGKPPGHVNEMKLDSEIKC